MTAAELHLYISTHLVGDALHVALGAAIVIAAISLAKSLFS